jgi:3-carboxy-cis,cis-muconate cycloisomerase
VVDAARMRRNLNATGGLIMAEAVMMGLAPQLGRDTAHHAVKHACDVALSRASVSPTHLPARRKISGKLNRAAIDGLTDPANYLGSTQAFIDRVLAEARDLRRGA